MGDRTSAVRDRVDVTRKRFARRQWMRRWLRWRAVVALLLIVVALIVTIWLFFFSSMLSVKGVHVQGEGLLSATELRAAARVEKGQALARVDLAAIENRVRTLAPVKDVDVVREWPDHIRIEIVERQAVAVVTIGDRLRGMDEDGVVFRDYAEPPPGLPRVNVTVGVNTEALVEAAQVVGDLPSDLRVLVDHVEVETIDQIRLLLKDGRTVIWGSADLGADKALVLPALLAQQGTTYDVSVPGTPTIRP